MRTVKDVEVQVQEKFGEALKQLDLLPRGYQCSARLHGKSRDKKRTASFERSWSPDTDSIHIRFQRTPEQASTASQPGARGTATAQPDHAPLAEKPSRLALESVEIG